jgi:hypothetical protein
LFIDSSQVGEISPRTIRPQSMISSVLSLSLRYGPLSIKCWSRRIKTVHSTYVPHVWTKDECIFYVRQVSKKKIIPNKHRIEEKESPYPQGFGFSPSKYLTLRMGGGEEGEGANFGRIRNRNNAHEKMNCNRCKFFFNNLPHLCRNLRCN